MSNQRLGHTVVDTGILGATGGRETGEVIGQLQGVVAEADFALGGIHDLAAFALQVILHRQVGGIVPGVHDIAVSAQETGSGTAAGVEAAGPGIALDEAAPVVSVAIFIGEGNPLFSVDAIGGFLGASVGLSVTAGNGHSAVFIFNPGLGGGVDLLDPLAVRTISGTLQVIQNLIVLELVDLVGSAVGELVGAGTPVPQTNNILTARTADVLEVHGHDGHLTDLNQDVGAQDSAISLGVGSGNGTLHGEVLLGTGGEGVARNSTEESIVNTIGGAIHIPGEIADLVVQDNACTLDGQTQIGDFGEVHADAGTAERDLLGLDDLDLGGANDFTVVMQLNSDSAGVVHSSGEDTGFGIDGASVLGTFCQSPGQAGLGQSTACAAAVNAHCLKGHSGGNIGIGGGGVILVVGGQAGVMELTITGCSADEQQSGTDRTGSTVGRIVLNLQLVGTLANGSVGSRTAAVHIQCQDTALCNKHGGQVRVALTAAGGGADTVGDVGHHAAVGTDTDGGTAVLQSCVVTNELLCNAVLNQNLVTGDCLIDIRQVFAVANGGSSVLQNCEVGTAVCFVMNNAIHNKSTGRLTGIHVKEVSVDTCHDLLARIVPLVSGCLVGDGLQTKAVIRMVFIAGGDLHVATDKITIVNRQHITNALLITTGIIRGQHGFLCTGNDRIFRAGDIHAILGHRDFRGRCERRNRKHTGHKRHHKDERPHFLERKFPQCHPSPFCKITADNMT